ESFVKLPGVLPPAVVRRLAERLDVLLQAEHGNETAGRYTALEQMWRADPLLRAVALSRRLGDIAAALVGADVRIYHDNALSKEPGCGRTPWHHDAEHFPLATLQAVTAWMPMSAVPTPMGPLSFAQGEDLRPVLAGLHFDRVETSYDRAVTERFVAAHVRVVDSAYGVGDVSFHGALCFHTAGGNRTTQTPASAGQDVLRRRRAGRRQPHADQRDLAGVPPGGAARRGRRHRAEPGGRPASRLTAPGVSCPGLSVAGWATGHRGRSARPGPHRRGP
ncbi:MAG: hypothetical protein QOC80_51, partial [Frankiaceae bacterium]|nr:hypothetical protein [Frankiaceae bacterium]